MKIKTKCIVASILAITSLTSTLSFSAFAVEKNDLSNTYGKGDLASEEYGPMIRPLKGNTYSEDCSSAPMFPDRVDLSESRYFPPIANQGLTNSCVAWAQAYYQFSYEVNKVLDRDATEENSFSPKWVYNLCNKGIDAGTSFDKVYGVMSSQGNLTMEDLPFDGNCKDWSPSEEVWTKSLDYRVESYEQIYFQEFDAPVTSPDAPALDEIKSALADGKIITYSTYVDCWNMGSNTIQSHKDAPGNEDYLNEYIVTEDSSTRGGHRMCIVGYNDNIWCDINSNGEVEIEEKGAFKVANSWGVDAKYHNDGFLWVSYDALNRRTSVPGAVSAYRREPIFRNMAIINSVTVESSCDINLVYTLNTSSRNQLNMIVSATSRDGEIVSSYVTPYNSSSNAFNENNSYSFDGTTSENDGTMVFSLDNIIPDITSENVNDYTWAVEIKDTINDSNNITVKDLKIVDSYTNQTYYSLDQIPKTINGSSISFDFGI